MPALKTGEFWADKLIEVLKAHLDAIGPNGESKLHTRSKMDCLNVHDRLTRNDFGNDARNQIGTRKTVKSD